MSFSESTSRRPFFVSVEGNIGAGKTTFMGTCNETGLMEVVPEPVEEWRNCNGNEYYRDPKTWGMSFQMLVNMTMLRNHVRPRVKDIRVVERSLGSARHCFVEMMKEDGTLNQVNYDILRQWYEFNEQHHRTKPDMIVYLRTTPEKAFKRMLNRSRTEEVGVKMEYLQRLHEQHEEWLGMEMEKNKRVATYMQGEDGIYVTVINADRPLHELPEKFQEACSNIYWASEGGI